MLELVELDVELDVLELVEFDVELEVLELVELEVLVVVAPNGISVLKVGELALAVRAFSLLVSSVKSSSILQYPSRLVSVPARVWPLPEL